MSDPTYLDEIFTNITAMQVELSAGWAEVEGQDIDAYDYFLHTQSQYPYWTSLPGRVQIQEVSANEDLRTHEILMSLKCCSASAGDRGEKERLWRGRMVEVLDFFALHRNLTCTAQPTKPKWLVNNSLIAECTGFTFPANETGGDLIIDYRLTAPCRVRVR